jgi:hypothetical protein
MLKVSTAISVQISVPSRTMGQKTGSWCMLVVTTVQVRTQFPVTALSRMLQQTQAMFHTPTSSNHRLEAAWVEYFILISLAIYVIQTGVVLFWRAFTTEHGHVCGLRH